MTIDKLMNQPVSIVTRAYTGQLDDYGNEIATETTTEVLGYLQQLTGTEREGYVPEASHLLVVPSTTAIQANDNVLAGSDEYQVLGPPADIYNPRLALRHHTEAVLRRIVSHQEAAA